VTRCEMQEGDEKDLSETPEANLTQVNFKTLRNGKVSFEKSASGRWCVFIPQECDNSVIISAKQRWNKIFSIKESK